MKNINDVKRRNTKQKQIIVEFLKNNQDEHLTADEILDKLKVKDLKVSKATVYRFLNNLSEDGTIRKYLLSESLSCCYQYVENASECNRHYHLICSECGKVIHFENDLVEKMKCDIYKYNNFSVDLKRISFYGLCKQCMEKEL